MKAGNKRGLQSAKARGWRLGYTGLTISTGWRMEAGIEEDYSTTG
jgi:hypothetical protein